MMSVHQDLRNGENNTRIGLSNRLKWMALRSLEGRFSVGCSQPRHRNGTDYVKEKLPMADAVRRR